VTKKKDVRARQFTYDKNSSHSLTLHHLASEPQEQKFAKISTGANLAPKATKGAI